MLKKLIEITNLQIEDNKERVFIELAILENKPVKEIKNLTIEQFDRLLNKYEFLYNNCKEVKDEFVIDGVTYKLPTTLFNAPYGIWEDIEAINSNSVFGDTFWEKLPYTLYVLTYGNNYVIDGASANIMEESKKFYNISIEDAIKVSNFFLLLKNPSLQSLRAYTKMKLLQKIKPLMKLL